MQCTDIVAKVNTRQLVKPRVKVHYPHVHGLPLRPAQTAVNHAIVDKMYAMLREQGYVQEPDMEITGEYKVHLNDKGLLSLTLEQFSYTKGAAHGMTYRHSLTFNLQDGHDYRLRELFKPDADFVRVISEKIKQEIKEKDIPLIADFEEIAENEEYYLTEDSLVIYFQLYQYTPYAYGFPEFSIPYEELAEILKPDGPIACLQQ